MLRKSLYKIVTFLSGKRYFKNSPLGGWGALLLLFLSIPGAHAVEFTDISKLDYAVYFEPVTGQIGNYVDIFIKEKTQMISTGYGIDLVMPDGFSVVEHESVRECEFAAYGGNKITKNNDNRFRFNYVISSANNMVAAGSDVVTQRVRLKIDKSVAPGDYAIVVTNSEIVSETGAAGTMKRPDDIYCRVTLQSKPVVTATTTSIDLRGFSDVFGLVDVSANPNVIIYANEGQVENENNVVVDDNCESLVLTDKFPFAIPADMGFHVDYACYEREDIKGTSTLYLPFGFKPSAFRAFTLDGESGGLLSFKETTKTCAAYTPLVICPKEGETSARVKIDKEDFDISPSSEKSATKNGYSFRGVLDTKVLYGAEGCFVFSAKDGRFKKCNDAGTTIRAFRCYVKTPESASGKSELGILFDGLTTGMDNYELRVTNYLQHSTELPVYDLQGRRVALPKANEVYIINGKKIIK